MATPVIPERRHCLLISANRTMRPYPVYPIGVAHLLGALAARGYSADHVDLLACGGAEKLRQLLTERRYDVTGISIRNIDSVDSASPELMVNDLHEVIGILRHSTSAPIVLGGPGFSIMPQALLNYLGADYGIVGEGEEAFPQLMATLIKGERPEQRLFSSPLPEYPHDSPLFRDDIAPFYLKYGGMLNIQTRRGCSYGCSYCTYPAIEGTTVRYRDAEEVADEVIRLTSTHGARHIFFTDSVFNDRSDHHLRIAEALIKRENKTPWSAFFRPQNITTDALRLMKRSGLSSLELGTDGTTDTTLAGINKGFTFDEVIEINERITDEHLPCAHFVIFGGPGETPATFRQGLENLDRLPTCVVFACIGMRILPGTALYRRALAERVLSEESDIISPVFYYSPQIDREELGASLRQAFANNPERIYPLEETETRIRMLHSLGHPGPLWDLLLINKLRK